MRALFLFVLLVLSSLVFAPPVTVCQSITAPGVYIQQNDLFGGGGGPVGVYSDSCIAIISQDVIYDCSGFSINNTGTPVANSVGIYFDSLTNITIRNCPMIYNYSVGVVVDKSIDSALDNLVLYNNSGGLYLLNGPININFSNSKIINSSSTSLNSEDISGLLIKNVSIFSYNLTPSSLGVSFSSLEFDVNVSDLNVTTYNTTAIFFSPGVLQENFNFSNIILKDISPYNVSTGFDIVQVRDVSIYNAWVSGYEIGFDASPLSHSAASISDSVFSNNYYGLSFANGVFGVLYNLTVKNTSFTNNYQGGYFGQGANVSLFDSYFYNNTFLDIEVNRDLPFPTFLNITNSNFSTAAGTNLTLSLNESSYDVYTLRSNVSAPSTFPTYSYFQTTSFNNKFINISAYGGPATITNVSVNWLDSELTGYDESRFLLYLYNSTGWYLLNDTPDTISNVLSYSNLLVTTDNNTLAILQATNNVVSCPVISSPGVYTQLNDLTGAPNPGISIASSSCVYIDTSDVIYDCNFFKLFRGSVAGTPAGFVITPGNTNVTIKNCDVIADYYTGIAGGNSILPSYNFTVYNNFLILNSTYGVRFDNVNDVNISLNSIESTNYGVYSLYGDNWSIFSNNFSNSQGTVPAIYVNGGDNFIIENNIFTNQYAGVFLQNPFNTTIVSNTFRNITNGPAVNLPFGSLLNNISYNFINLTGSYGISIDSGPNTTIYSNVLIDDVTSSSTAISITQSNYSSILLNNISSFNSGIAVLDSNFTTVNDNLLYNLGVSTAINLDFALGPSYNVSVNNNKLSNVSAAFSIDRFGNLTLTNNYVENASSFVLQVGGSTSPVSNVKISNLTLNSTSNNYSLSIDIYHNVLNNWAYRIYESATTIPTPNLLGFATTSFRNKTIGIESISGAPIISNLSLRWYNSELSGYDESRFILVNNSGVSWSNWDVLVPKPNVANNILYRENFAVPNSLTRLSILQQTNLLDCPIINSPGSYVQPNPFNGAPNSYTGIALSACVVFNSSDIIYDCDGNTITNSGVPTAAAIGLNAIPPYNYVNITVKNCPSISQYYIGADLFSVILFNSSFTLNDYGIYATGGSNVSDVNVSYSTTSGIRVGSTSSLDNVRILHSLSDAISVDASSPLYNLYISNASTGINSVGDVSLFLINASIYNTTTGILITDFSTISSANISNVYIFNATDSAVTAYPSSLIVAYLYLNNLTINASSVGLNFTNLYYPVNLSDIQIIDSIKAVQFRPSIFGSAAFEPFNFTNISLISTAKNSLTVFDMLIDFDSTLTGFDIKDSPIPSPLPTYFGFSTTSFANKAFNISITAGSPVANYLSLRWYDSELTGYSESNFLFYNYTSGVWQVINNTPETTLNVLSVSNQPLVNNQVYSILQVTNNVISCPVISTPGVYTQLNDLLGAPNPTIFGTNACVIINSSDVIYDCNNFGVRRNTALGTDYGFVIHDVTQNVTVKNCNPVGDYSIGVELRNAQGVNLSSNQISNTTAYGLQLLSSSNNNLLSNQLYNSSIGIGLFSSSNNNLTSNQLYNSTTAIQLTSSSNNNLLSNQLYNSTSFGIILSTSSNNNLTSNQIYNSSFYGIYVFDSSNVRSINDYLFNTSNLLRIQTSATQSNINFSNLSVNSTNYNYGLNLDFYDANLNIEDYSIRESPVPSPLPTYFGFSTTSFANKAFNVSVVAGSPVLDSLNVRWYDSELTGYSESNFLFYNYTSGVWQVINNTPETTLNVLSVSNQPLVNNQVYSILQFILSCPVITSPGSYTQLGALSGAPNFDLTSGISACVLIDSSDVIYDCDGFGIARAGAAGTTAGVLVTQSKNNVTVRNCNVIEDYEYGVYLDSVSNSTVFNNTLVNITGSNLDYSAIYLDFVSINNTISSNTILNSSKGIRLRSASGFNILFNNTLYNISNDAIDLSVASNNTISFNNISESNNGVSLATASNNNTVDSNLIYSASNVGLIISVGSSNNTLTNNSIYSSATSFAVTSSSNNVFSNSYIYNSSLAIDVGSSNNTLISDTYVYNSSTLVLRLGLGIDPMNNITLTNLTIDSPTYLYNVSLDWFDNNIPAGDGYTIAETSPSVFTNYNGFAYAPFRNKAILLSSVTGTSIVDSLSLRWYDPEVPPYNEAQFALFNESTAPALQLLNNTPDTVGNVLSLFNHAFSTSYKLLIAQTNNSIVACPRITSPGTYVQAVNLVDYPNSVTSINVDNACVVIESSDVVYDCNNNDIVAVTDPGFLLDTAAIYISQNLQNVTVRNCNIAALKPSYAYYSYGVYAENSENILVTSSSITNVSGIYFSSVNDSNITYNTIFNSSGVTLSSSNNTLISHNNFTQFFEGIRATDGNYTDVFNNTFNSTVLFSTAIYFLSENNSIVRNNNISADLRGFEAGYGFTDNIRVENNIFRPSGLVFEALSTVTELTVNTSDNLFIDSTVGLGNGVLNMLRDHFNNSLLKVTSFAYPGPSLNLTYVLFDSDGTLTNYSNISFYDSSIILFSDEYNLSWAGPVSGNEPLGYRTFREKNLLISTSSPFDIDYIIFHWTNAESAGYDESKFTLMNNTSPPSAWTVYNRNPDTVNNLLQNNTITLSSGVLSMMVSGACPLPINTSGTYTLTTSLEGASNPANEFGAGYLACVKISASDVIFDCAGYNISNNGTTNAMAMAINATSNVTVRNCGISDYDLYGIAVGPNVVTNSDVSLLNNTIYNIAAQSAIFADVVNDLFINGSNLSSSAASTAVVDASSINGFVVKDTLLSGAPAAIRSFTSSDILLDNLDIDSVGLGIALPTTANVNNITVSRVDLTNVANGPAVSVGSVAFTTTDVNVSYVSVSSSTLTTDALQFTGVTNGVLSNNNVDTTNTFFTGSTLNNVQIFDNTKTGAASAGSFALDVSNSNDIFVFNNNFDGADIGIRFNTVSNSRINSTTITNIIGTSAINLISSTTNLSQNTMNSLADDGILATNSNLNVDQNTITATNNAIDLTNTNANLSSNTLTSATPLIIQGGVINSTTNILNPTANAISASGTMTLNVSQDSINNAVQPIVFSVNDNLAAGETLQINFSSTDPLPAGYSLFNNKSVLVTTSAPVDDFALHWTDAELGGFSETSFELQLNATGTWLLLNNTPDITNNVLSNSTLAITGIYAILSTPPTGGGGGDPNDPPKQLYAQLLLQGCNTNVVKITDQDGDPVENADVLVKVGASTFATGQTDSNGEFVLPSCTEQQVTVTADKSGYASTSITASLTCSCGSLDISIGSACEGNTVTVSSSGSAVEDAFVVVTTKELACPDPALGGFCELNTVELASGYTDSSGQFTFEGCGKQVTVSASKPGYDSDSITSSLVDCDSCDQCQTDADCPDDFFCDAGECKPKDDEKECETDADCPDGLLCVNNVCVDGCRDDSDCSEGQVCNIPVGDIIGVCEDKKEDDDPSLDCDEQVQLGEDIVCDVLLGDDPCANCTIEVRDPDGDVFEITSDDEGKASIKAEKTGDYLFTLGSAKDFSAVLPLLTDVYEEEKPVYVENPAVLCIVFLVLLLILFLLWKRRRKEEEVEEEEEES